MPKKKYLSDQIGAKPFYQDIKVYCGIKAMAEINNTASTPDMDQ
jgi:hypothetical protein